MTFTDDGLIGGHARRGLSKYSLLVKKCTFSLLASNVCTGSVPIDSSGIF